MADTATYRTIWRWHFYIGLLVAPVLIVLAATGALALVMRLLARIFGHSRAALLGGSIKALLLGGGVALFALGLQQLDVGRDDLATDVVKHLGRREEVVVYGGGDGRQEAHGGRHEQVLVRVEPGRHQHVPHLVRVRVRG